MKKFEQNVSLSPVLLLNFQFDPKKTYGADFLEWAISEKVLSRRGFSSAGPGWLAMVYELKDKERIEKWFRDRKFEIVSEEVR